MAAKHYYSKKELKERGWTDALIRDLLSEVELREDPTRVGRAPLRPLYFYEDSKVHEIEKTDAFKKREQKRNTK
jgi:hypothetical protein